MDKVWKRENSATQNKVWAFFQYLSNDFLKETFPLSFLNTFLNFSVPNGKSNLVAVTIEMNKGKKRKSEHCGK